MNRIETPLSSHGHFLTDINEISNSSDYQDCETIVETIEFETSGIAPDIVSTKREGGDISPRIIETLITETSERNRMKFKEIGRISGKTSSSS